MSSLKIAIETLAENQIREVTLDGQEHYVQSMSMSENLTYLAHKIDFSKDESLTKVTSEAAADEEEEKTDKAFQQAQWPWQSIHMKLKQSVTEANVLLDVLKIAKEKQYLVVDAVQQDPPESKVGFQVNAKKKSLSAASTILLNGAEHLRKAQADGGKKQTAADFHYELLKLRQNWRLKKVGHVILGDLSYKSCGSRYWQSGTFEVTKRDVDIKDEPLSDTLIGALRQETSSMQVTVPSELEGIAYIHVAIRKLKEDTDLSSTHVTLPANNMALVPQDMPWQQKLEMAQNVLFCKEVFQQLSREAVKLKSSVPHIVIGNQIYSHLFPGIQLSIVLCHNTNKERRPKLKQSPPAAVLGSKTEDNPVLEHSLHQLLREAHHHNIYTDLPHPASALLGMSKQRRMAGPHAYTRDRLVNMSHKASLLEQVVNQAKHIVLCRQTIWIIDDMASSVSDPQITAHWCNVNSAEQLTIKLHLTTQGYDSIKTPMLFQVGVDQIKAIDKLGRVCILGSEQAELKNYILTQIAQHQMNVLHLITKYMGWTLTAFNTHVGVGDLENIGCPLAISVVSPDEQSVLSVRSGAASGVTVSLQESSSKVGGGEEIVHDNDPVTNTKWRKLAGQYKSVQLDTIEGRNLPNKFEMLLAALTEV